MSILISKVRIENYRSISNAETELGLINLLIGANNCGKSNFLRAINASIGQGKICSEEDIYIGEGESLDHSRQAIIDIMFRPIDENGKDAKHFSDFWTGVFTEDWITVDETSGDYVGIRTTIKHDPLRNEYILERRPINDWRESITSALVGKRKSFTVDMVNYLSAFYMDAQRDVVEDIRDKKSYFGRATSRVDLPPEKVESIEEQLNNVNTEIVESIPALSETSARIASVAPTVGAGDSTVEIEPLARKITDLHKGMDIVFKDGNAARLSISQHGMGTRSWISFLTLGAYVDWERKSLLEEDPEADPFVVLTMEEPEAHLHPQAQQKIYSQLEKFSGQKIISTHSPSVVTQASLDELIHFEKSDGKTIIKRFDPSLYKNEQINRIRREVIATRGELLFSKAIVLCEGITEEQALPIFFEECFECNPIFLGINIIGIGGQNYKTFLLLLKNFGIPWFIFSDGEDSTIKTVDKATLEVFGKSAASYPNVVFIDNKDDYEKQLIHAGYQSEIQTAIDKCEGKQNYIQEYIRKKNHKSSGRQVTDKPRCKTCGQEIYEDVIRDYDGKGGLDQAIYDCCTDKNAKAKYASYVAQEIVKSKDTYRRIPPKIFELFKCVRDTIHINMRSDYESITQPTGNS